jgi:hypothetical protein
MPPHEATCKLKKDPSLLECYATLTGSYRHFEGQAAQASIHGRLDHNEGAMILQNSSNYLAADTVLPPRRLKSSSTVVREPQISHAETQLLPVLKQNGTIK